MFRSIQTRLMFYLVPFSVIITIIMVSILLYSQYYLFNNAVNDNLFATSLVVEKSIATIMKELHTDLGHIDYDFLSGQDGIEYSIFSKTLVIFGEATPFLYDLDFEGHVSLQYTYKNHMYYRSVIRRFSDAPLADYYIVLDVPNEKITANKNHIITLTIVLLLSLYIFIWILGKRISFSIQRPIKRLAVLADKMVNDQLNTEIMISSNDELADIADSFNKLQNNLKSVMKEVLVKTGETAEMNEIMEYVHRTENHLPTGIIGVDNSGLITVFNEPAQSITSIPPGDVLGKNILNPMPIGLRNLITPLKACLSLGRIKLKVITDIYNPLNHKTTVLYSTMIQFDEKKKVIGALVLFKRIEDMERFEKSAEQNRSLRYLGEISASLAHEMRNPLTSIKGYAQYLQMMLSERTDIQKDFAIIMHETDRIEGMLRNFLKFAKPDIPKKELSDLNGLLSYVVNLLKGELPSNITVIQEYEKIPNVMIDMSQFESVFLNLFLNAIHAMPSGGVLCIKTHYSTSRKMVILEISDTGVGIPKDFAEKIFMPFSTTKSDGTGLGLAICNRIVDTHNGIIEVESKEGHGTKFTILLKG